MNVKLKVGAGVAAAFLGWGLPMAALSVPTLFGGFAIFVAGIFAIVYFGVPADAGVKGHV